MLDIKIPPKQSIYLNSNFGATAGENRRDLPSRITKNQAVRVQNYFVTGDGKLTTREGLTNKATVVGSPSMIEPFDSDTLMYAYDDGTNSKLYSYKISTETSTLLNTFSSRNDVCGTKFGKWFYSSDKQDKIQAFFPNGRFLNYDDQKANFYKGDKIVGETSGAYGTIYTQYDAGTSGTLVLKDIVGNFEDNEYLYSEITCTKIDYTGKNKDLRTGQKYRGSTSGATGDLLTLTVKVDDTGTLFFRNVVGTFVTGETIYAINQYTNSSNVIADSAPSSIVIVAKTINFDTQTENFLTGSTITGGTSGAKGILISQNDAGATGNLFMYIVSGTFQNNELLTGAYPDPNSPFFQAVGSATSDGTVYGGQALVNQVVYDAYELEESTPCSILKIFNTSDNKSFLVAGNTTVNESEIRWSAGYTDPLAIPFLDWTIVAPPLPASPGLTNFEAGGTLNAIVPHDYRLFCFFNDATCVFHLETINVDGTGLAQNTIADQQGNNFGGYAAISTPKGLFFTNENGIHYFTLNGSSDISVEISNILGENTIEGLNFDDSDMEWDGKSRLYVTLKENSDDNNFVLVYDIELQAWTEITGWNIRRLCRASLGNKNDLYGVSSINGKLYKLFDGYSDDGLTIDGRILLRQENGGDYSTLKDMLNIWLQGTLSPSSVIKIGIHKWDRRNTLKENAKVFWWNGDSVSGDEPAGYGITSFGKGFLSSDSNSLKSENFVHKGRVPLRNFLKYEIELTSSYDTPHEIHLVLTEILNKFRVKLNNLSTIKE